MPQTPHIERQFTASDTARGIVIGMSDGLTVPIALAAGLSGAVGTTGVVAMPVLPFTPAARLFDFRPLAISFVILLGGIPALYFVATEITKMLFNGPA